MIESVIRDAVSGAYTTAFLLSGSAKCAEAVVLKNIELMNSDGASGEELFQAAVKAAIKLDEIPGECAGEPCLASSMLPYELQMRSASSEVCSPVLRAARTCWAATRDLRPVVGFGRYNKKR